MLLAPWTTFTSFELRYSIYKCAVKRVSKIISAPEFSRSIKYVAGDKNAHR